ncbi:MAG TPA: acetate/propionate family kinase [Gemmataceae bacterium]
MILTLNSGSSSLKAALFHASDPPRLELRALLENIRQPRGRFTITGASGEVRLDEAPELPDHARAMDLFFERVKEHGTPQAVGHRVVHGGPRFTEPARVTDELLAEVRRLTPFVPLHLPPEIAAVEYVARAFPDVPQIACFDTAFHRTLPEVARTFALPERLLGEGVRRYGFHGLSYESILGQLREVSAPEADGRVIVAHLGNGASMAAVRGGECVETTMGFTPTAGLVMGTRPGDLDPGLLVYLMRAHQLGPDETERILNKESGLLGLSGRTNDVAELLRREASDPAAKLALDVFCYQARKWVGALAAALGGLETLVFTAGIGENAPAVRARICSGVEHLGVTIDAGRNAENAAVISADGARVAVRVMKTDEELVIARHIMRLLGG